MFNICIYNGNQNYFDFILQPMRISKINKTTDISLWLEFGIKGPVIHCWWKHKLEKTLWKSVWQFLRMMETDIQQDPAITILRCLPKGHFTLPQTHLLNMFIVALLTMASNWEQPMCSSTDDYIKKNVIHVHNEIFLCY